MNIIELQATYSAARARLSKPPSIIVDVNARETTKAERAQREQAKHRNREHLARNKADRIAHKTEPTAMLYREVPIEGQNVNDPVQKDSVDQIKFNFREMIRAVSTVYNISQADLYSSRRIAKIVKPRHIAMWAIKKTTKMSLPQIGRRFAGRDHTTVLHAVNKIQALVDAGQIDPLPNLISAVLKHRDEIKKKAEHDAEYNHS